MKITLERFAYTPNGTFGELIVGEHRWYTIERPWRNNLRNVSCIPEGTYPLRLGRYHRGGYPAYELRDVPGRSLIKIHIGNTQHDLAGCVAPGMALGCVYGHWAVTGSRNAFRGFMAAMDGIEAAEIEIVHQPLPNTRIEEA